MATNVQLDLQIIDYLSDYRNRACHLGLVVEDFIIATNGLARNDLITLSNLMDEYQNHIQEILKEMIPMCLVCSSPAENDLVKCSRCKTIHHSECWEYNGKCSVFGCGCGSIQS